MDGIKEIFPRRNEESVSRFPVRRRVSSYLITRTKSDAKPVVVRNAVRLWSKARGIVGMMSACI